MTDSKYSRHTCFKCGIIRPSYQLKQIELESSSKVGGGISFSPFSKNLARSIRISSSRKIKRKILKWVCKDKSACGDLDYYLRIQQRAEARLEESQKIKEAKALAKAATEENSRLLEAAQELEQLKIKNAQASVKLLFDDSFASSLKQTIKSALATSYLTYTNKSIPSTIFVLVSSGKLDFNKNPYYSIPRSKLIEIRNISIEEPNYKNRLPVNIIFGSIFAIAAYYFFVHYFSSLYADISEYHKYLLAALAFVIPYFFNLATMKLGFNPRARRHKFSTNALHNLSELSNLIENFLNSFVVERMKERISSSDLSNDHKAFGLTRMPQLRASQSTDTEDFIKKIHALNLDYSNNVKQYLIINKTNQ